MSLLARTLNLPRRGFWRRLRDRVELFGLMLVHGGAADPRPSWLPMLLGAWIAAHLIASPLSLAWHRLLRGHSDFRRVVGVNLGIGALHAVGLAMSWYVLGWGQRSLDGTSLAVTTLIGGLVAAWGFEQPPLRGFVYAAGQTALALVLFFVGWFTATELGWLP